MLFTLPSGNQLRYVSGDTTYAYCAGGPPLSDLQSVRLYGQPATGGGYQFLRQHDARGREGLADSFMVDPGVGWHFYVTATDTAGNESCASNIVWVEGSVTGVPALRGDPVTSVTLYDVQGRRIRKPTASGVYFEVARRRSGHFSAHKRVIVH